MATGNVSIDSDFDVIVGVRRGRMFSARFFSILVCDLFGWRRRNLDHGAAAADTICLNHFVTEAAYRLSPPYEEYWKLLYRRLVPVCGHAKNIQAFFDANRDWRGGHIEIRADRRYRSTKGSVFKRGGEQLLSGMCGNWFEKLFRAFQLRRIQEKLVPRAGYRPRLTINDEELELHLDTRRIEEFNARAD